MSRPFLSMIEESGTLTSQGARAQIFAKGFTLYFQSNNGNLAKTHTHTQYLFRWQMNKIESFVFTSIFSLNIMQQRLARIYDDKGTAPRGNAT